MSSNDNRVVLVMGFPASGKSRYSQSLIDQGYIHLNRDKHGGTIADLVPLFQQELKKGSNVVLDNTFPSVLSRKPFIDAAKEAGVSIHCIHVNTDIENAQINALHRMWAKHGKLFLGQDDYKEANDPNIFPVAVIFKYKKDFQKPSVAEGFATVETKSFVREPIQGYTNKALICDYDDTLRRCVGGENDYPVKPEEVEVLPGRREKLLEYKEKGYILLGVSNQSGVAKGKLTYEAAVACFNRTNELLGLDIDYMFCPHNVVGCYCRKPQSGAGVQFIHKYKLDPSQCIFVGDRTTDKTFAKRLGFKYYDVHEFFR